jgi:hypothetical protein
MGESGVYTIEMVTVEWVSMRFWEEIILVSDIFDN